jgi:hypothetical protein
VEALGDAADANESLVSTALWDCVAVLLGDGRGEQ